MKFFLKELFLVKNICTKSSYKRMLHCSTKPECVSKVLYVYIILLGILIQHKLATGNALLLTSSFSFEDVAHEML